MQDIREETWAQRKVLDRVPTSGNKANFRLVRMKRKCGILCTGERLGTADLESNMDAQGCPYLVYESATSEYVDLIIDHRMGSKIQRHERTKVESICEEPRERQSGSGR